MKLYMLFFALIVAVVASPACAIVDVASSAYVDAKVAPVEEKIDTHVEDDVKHITANERDAWNAKQDALSAEQLAAVNSGVTSEMVESISDVAETIAGALSGVEASSESDVAGCVTDIERDGHNVTFTKSKITSNEIASNAAISLTQLSTGVRNSLALADGAIPRPDEICDSPDTKCVLTYDNSVYYWEAIGR